jgi:predicted alpha/beta hydrolase
VNEEPEPLEIRTRDGEWLGAELCEPRGRRILGTAIFAHPMFAHKAVFSRPRGDGVARLFADAGWRTLAFDFRGHGDSTSQGVSKTPKERPWSYDDLVRIDLPTVVDAARARWPRSRLVIVGHSLGGHVALAAVGAGLVAVDALIVASANVWMRHLEPSRRVWLRKLGAIAGLAALVKSRGYFPARALRLGSDDEAAPYIEDLARFALQGRWTSRAGTVDYEASLASIVAPVFSLTSAGDAFYCRSECATRMLASVRSCTHHRVEVDDRGGPAPGHIGLLTGVHARSGWRQALAWLATARATSSGGKHPAL